MRNVQVWSIVAALLVANCSFGQLLRSRRQCCQPVCQNCNYVSTANYTEYASAPVESVSAPVYNATASYGEVISEPAYTDFGSTTASNAIYESPVSFETPVSTASQVTYETPVVSTQSYEVPVATAVATTPVVSTPVVSTPVVSTPVYQAGTPVTPVSYVQPAGMTMTNASYTVKSTPRVTKSNYSATYQNANSDQMRVLSVVNRKRQRSGLSPLRFDANLASVAQRKSYYRASRGMTGHDGTNMGGASVEGVGFSYGQADPVEGFNTCYLYSNGYQSCGCAVSYDANNRAYYTLLLR